MKAVVQRRYGSPDLLAVEEVAEPVARDGEVLVRVRAASVHPDVWHVVTGRPRVLRIMGGGVRRPKQPVPGTDIAGVVEETGPGAKRFRPGDAVLGETIKGYQWANGGAFAELVAVPEDWLAPKPGHVTFEQAASVPTSGIIALSGIRDQGGVAAGHEVLVNGAAGGVGAIALQIAKAHGARVTGVDVGDKLDLVRSLGADRVLDYERDDFTLGDERYDVILDVPGNRSFREVRRALAPAGRYVLIGHDAYGREGRATLGSLPRFFRLMARSPFTRQLPSLDFSTPDKPSSLAYLAGLLESGALTPVVDRTGPLAEAAAAIRRLESGRARGKIVLTMP